ncbi:hypothetical protein N9N67_06400 [Bacteriovoracaceae bacterium]|nr:hypothetical protein [Bacteriovoracaceae bacterium]
MIYFNIKKNGFSNLESPIKGYLLHKDNEFRFLYTDGNRRLGILGYLSKKNKKLLEQDIYVDIRGEFFAESFLNNSEVKENLNKSGMSSDDAKKWFDNVFR